MRDSDAAALQEALSRLGDLAAAAGLAPLPVHFEVVPSTILYEVAAYGLPGRFSHWSHGKAYQSLKAQYDLGLVKYFELVVHSDPAEAFLLESNDLLTNKLVAGHVLGHADFFARNAHFRAAPRDMADRAPLHADRLRGYEFAHGRAEVEALLDALLAIEDHVDPGAAGPPPMPLRGLPPGRAGAGPVPGRVAADAEAVEARAATLFPRREGAGASAGRRGPEGADLLLFLARHAPDLEDWQRDAIDMVRDEALYFRPQLRTKVMNEGWATLWHTRLLRDLPLSDGEYLDFARLNAGVRAAHPGAINPYLLGVAIYEDIVERLGERDGLRECFLIREVEDDVAFVRNHFTREVAERLDMFVYSRRDEGGQALWKVTATDFEAVRDALVRSREACGRPVVAAVDFDHGGARELLLEHSHDGRDLELADAQKALEHVARIWRHRCRLRTRIAGEARELVADPPRRG